MLNNLRAEMARYGISTVDIAKVTGKTERSIRDKLIGKTQFSIPDAMAVRDHFFPEMSLEYLFNQGIEQDAG